MNILNKLHLRHRLILMVLIPLLGMIWVSGWNTAEKILLSNEMGKLQGLVSVTTRVGALVHELQKERGMSAGFIGSQGANFADTLPKQRALSDEQRQALTHALSTFDATAFGTQLSDRIAQVRQQLDGLDGKRQAISSLSIPAPEAIGYYTSTIATLLSIPGDLPALSSDKDITRLASTYNALLQTKERAGIERATLSNVFGADKFTPEMLLRFVRNAAEQDTWFMIFGQYATPEHAKFAADSIKGSAVDEVIATKKAALAKMNESSLSINAKQWFAAATARIDLMKIVEDRLANDLTTAMGNLQVMATRIAWGYAAVLLVATLFILIIMRFITRRILSQIGGEPETAVDIAHAVAAGNLDNDITLTAGDDVSILASMQRMQQQLKARIEAERAIAESNLRIKVGLYSSTAAITISDAAELLVHATPVAENLLKTISGHSLDNLLGQKLTDTVITDADTQSGMADAVKNGHDLDTVLGGHHLRLSTRPILDEEGRTLGRVTTWLDRTPEVQVEQEVAEIVEAAAMGILSMRLDVTGKTGFFASLGNGINQFLDNTDQAIAAVSDVLGRMAKGDLTRTVEGDYSGTFAVLKDDTNATVEHLREVVGQIKEASEAINIAAQEIAAGNQDLSARTEEQASSLEETASSMEELNATVRNNADNSRQANELAKNSNDIAVKGGAMVKNVIVTMDEIQESSRKIADIITVIDSIAFQTNILALNAAVEAARAGEQGRGFAVVASEVRNLAQRSATAAKEIKTLIAESVDKVESGTKLVGNAGRTMDDVVTSFEKVTHLVTGISDASREQSSGIDQVTKAVTQMDEVTQQNAALVEEAAAAAESLEEQARNLVKAVAMFKLTEGGANSVTSTNLPAPPLRTVTGAPPKQITRQASQPTPSPSSARPTLPAQLSDPEDEWAEF